MLTKPQTDCLFRQLNELLEREPFLLATCDRRGRDAVVLSNIGDQRTVLELARFVARRVEREVRKQEEPGQ